MAASPADLFALLDRLGIAQETASHPPLFTVAESRLLQDRLQGAHTKNLFLRNKAGVLVLVTALEHTRVDLKALGTALGLGRFSFGAPELLEAVLGVPPGSVTPFALINDREARVRVVLDAAMMACAELNFHPLVNTMTTRVSSADFLRFLAATGHRPEIRLLGGTDPGEAPAA